MSRVKYLGLIGLIVVLVLLSFVIAYWLGLNEGLSFSPESAAKPSGRVTVIGRHPNGTVFYYYTTPNAIMTIGSRYIRNILGFNNVTDMNATISISLSADPGPQTDWTKLPTETTVSGLTRANGTASVVNSTAYQVEKTWIAGAPATVNCTGLHWSSTSDSSGNMLAAASISSVSLILNDQLTVTWTVNIPAG